MYSLSRASMQRSGPPAAAVAATMNVDVSYDYLATLGDSGAFQDGGLSGDELLDPEAAALVTALQGQIAEQLGVDPNQVTITVSHNSLGSSRL